MDRSQTSTSQGGAGQVETRRAQPAPTRLPLRAVAVGASFVRIVDERTRAPGR